MSTFAHQFFTSQRTALLLFSLILTSSLVILSSYTTLLPLHVGDFLFFSILALLGALYRPGWLFLLFIATIPLETVNLAPQEFGITLRPYQFLGALTLCAVAIRFFLGRLNFALPRFAWHDGALLLFSVGGFLALPNASDGMNALKQALVVFSFVILYAVVRIFVQKSDDVRRIVPFFLVGSAVSIFYGIWQNWAFMHGIAQDEIMPGRPNGTFPEADWFGLYLAFVLTALFGLWSYFRSYRPINDRLRTFFMILLGVMAAATTVALILTVSRSAWLGAAAAIGVFLVVDFWRRESSFRAILINGVIIFGVIAISIIAIHFASLTSFELKNRLSSISSGKQNITISCDAPVNLPVVVSDIALLAQYGCRHIMLEEIAQERSRGAFVTTVLRDDPNVQTRMQLYKKSLALIMQHPFMGIGWGSAGIFFGADARDATLNTSNIFMETWLGGGMLSLAMLGGILGAMIAKTMRHLRRTAFDASAYALAVFVLLGLCAIIIPNFFNAGLLLGFVWVFFGIALMQKE